MMKTYMIVKVIPYMQVRGSSEDKSMFLVHFKKAFTLSLYLGTHLKEELIDYCFVLKVTTVFSVPTQAKQTEDGGHFAND